MPPKVPVEWSLERPSSRAPLGAASAALGPALLGYAADGFMWLKGEPFYTKYRRCVCAGEPEFNAGA